MCEGSRDREYCWHTHPAAYTTTCGESFACPASSVDDHTPVVCGPSPWAPLLCVAEGGLPGWQNLFGGHAAAATAYGEPSCSGLRADSAAFVTPQCATAQAHACAQYSKETERCYDRAVELTSRGLVEKFYVVGEGESATVLWTRRLPPLAAPVAPTPAPSSEPAMPAVQPTTPIFLDTSRAPTPPTRATGCCVSFEFEADLTRCCFRFTESMQASACTVPPNARGGMEFHPDTACSDVASAMPTAVLPTLPTLSPVVTVSNDVADLDRATDGERCRLIGNDLAFCGTYVTYPTSMPLRHAVVLDEVLGQKFAEVRRLVHSHDAHLVGSPTACTGALAREMCMQTFPMCEGSANLQHCWHAPPAQSPTKCTEAYVCRADTHTAPAPLVCLSGNPTMCAREGGGPTPTPGACAGLTSVAAESPTAVAPQCGANQTAECTHFGKPSGRCFERGIRPAPRGAPVTTVEVFFASGGAENVRVLWTPALFDSVADDGGHEGYHRPVKPVGVSGQVYGPVVAAVAALLLVAFLVLKFRRDRNGAPVAYTEVGGGYEDSSDDDQDNDDYTRSSTASPSVDSDVEAARLVVTERMKQAT